MLETGAQPDAEHEFDIRVGERLRALRRAARLTQTALGNRIGVTFQQVQKYENGSNRMSASRLWLVARCLGVPVSALFSDYDHSDAEGPATDAARLLDAWRLIDPAHKTPILALIETLAVGPRARRAKDDVSGSAIADVTDPLEP
ncbi:MAG: transcriptional regulator [Alphaproteobacteria bacterium]|nr:MAG: transcriptional regulator [Alphaproteobacteria bacterium]PZO39880.1 MAG: transcriptional regulator [Alphaproteobacteria bacterium]